MRNDIDSMQENMDRLLETMLSMTRKESNDEIIAESRNIATQIGSSPLNIPKVTNPIFGFVHPEGVSIPPPNLGTQNHSVASSQHESLYDDEDPYDSFFTPPHIRFGVGTFPGPAVARLRALEEKFKSLEVNSTPALKLSTYAWHQGL